LGAKKLFPRDTLGVTEKPPERPSEPPHEETETRRLELGAREPLSVHENSRPCILVMAGAGIGSVHRLRSGETFIGRSQSAGLRITEDGVSRRHARIFFDRGRVTIEDLGSANGTFVNGIRVDRIPLSDGDRIRIGVGTLLKFAFSDTVEESFHRQMYQAVLLDPLTGVFNTQYLKHRVESEISYALRHRTSLALILVEIDGFTALVDDNGREVADQVIVQLARRIQWALRNEDVMARYGNEHFAILCRGIPTAGVVKLVERLRTVAKGQKFAFERLSLQVTISLGVATYPELVFANGTELVTAAMGALAQATRGGRERIVMATVDWDEEPTTVQGRKVLPEPPSQR
jgi:diguanylate cyclase (GGDEF)-like protein